MRTKRRRKQSGWGSFGFPTLLLVVVLAGGCRGGDETVESVAAEPPTSADPVASSTTSAITSTTKGHVVEQAPRFFTAATPSGSYQMTVGASSTIQLPAKGPVPEARGESVLLVDVASVGPAGSRQWELRAVSSGRTTVVVEQAGQALTWILLVAG